MLRPKLSENQKKVSNELKNILLNSEEYEFNKDEMSFLSLSQHRANKELDEAKRLLYVALTRASKSLLVSCMVKGNASFDYSGKGIIEDLKTVLGWNSTDEFQRIFYGGTMPLSFKFIALKSTPEQAEEKDSIQEECSILPASLSELPALQVFNNMSSKVLSYTSLAQGLEDDSCDDAFLNIWCDKDDGAADFSLSKSRDEALEFGRAFHRCAQKCILEARNQPDRQAWLSDRDGYCVDYLQNNQGFSGHLQNRLRHALDALFLRDELQNLLTCDDIDAEVPFMVSLSSDDKELFLEGEIDALGTCLNRDAFFIDYKTGGTFSETAEEVYQKHLLQAQCYSYALLKEGFSNVIGVFIRVDFLTQEPLSCVDSVTYSFDESNQKHLREAIFAAYESGQAKQFENAQNTLLS